MLLRVSGPFLTGERTPEGYYRVRDGLDSAIARGLAYAPYADLVWFETSRPDPQEARRFAEAIHTILWIKHDNVKRET